MEQLLQTLLRIPEAGDLAAAAPSLLWTSLWAACALLAAVAAFRRRMREG